MKNFKHKSSDNGTVKSHIYSSKIKKFNMNELYVQGLKNF